MAYAGLLTTEMIDDAFEIIKPSIWYMYDREYIKHIDMHLVVMNPLMPYAGDYSLEAFNAAVLWEESVTDIEWEHDYAAIARRKAAATWRTGMPTRVIRECAPHLLALADTRYGGSDINMGLISACSGVEPWRDAQIAGMLNCAIIGNANHKMQNEIIPGDNDFITG